MIKWHFIEYPLLQGFFKLPTLFKRHISLTRRQGVMESQDDKNHITKSALEFYSKICNRNEHPKLAKRSQEMANEIKCNPSTKCSHNMVTI